jgi:hypothetical protein
MTEQQPTRRRIVQGAAWAVPVIAVGAPVPALAASPPNEECQPDLSVQPGSFKCCNTATKNMKVVLKITDANGCGIPAEVPLNILDVILANGQDRGTLTWADSEGNVLPGPPSVVLGDTFIIYLGDTDSCTVNLLVEVEGYGFVPITSDNIPGGNTAGDCVP